MPTLARRVIRASVLATGVAYGLAAAVVVTMLHGGGVTRASSLRLALSVAIAACLALVIASFRTPRRELPRDAFGIPPLLAVLFLLRTLPTPAHSPAPGESSREIHNAVLVPKHDLDAIVLTKLTHVDPRLLAPLERFQSLLSALRGHTIGRESAFRRLADLREELLRLEGDPETAAQASELRGELDHLRDLLVHEARLSERSRKRLAELLTKMHRPPQDGIAQPSTTPVELPQGHPDPRVWQEPDGALAPTKPIDPVSNDASVKHLAHAGKPSKSLVLPKKKHRPDAHTFGFEDITAAGIPLPDGASTHERACGPANEGTSQAQYVQVYAKYRSIAEEALLRDDLPAGYRFYVRRYFDFLRPD